MKTKSLIQRGLILFVILSSIPATGALVLLHTDQIGYTFQTGNTYYITNTVTVYGTTTIEAGTVIKYGLFGQLILETLDCQTVSTNPAILTARDDDRFGETVAGSTHTPSGYYGLGDPFLIYSLSDTQVHDLQFYFLANGLGLINEADNETSITYGLWNLWMEDCDWGIDCENTVSAGENILNITNLTMIDCTGGIAGHYNIAGNIVDSTFRNVGGLVSDDNGYFFNSINFSWCVFTNVGLGAFEVNVLGDHNGFADCGEFSNYDYNYGSWSGTNYFGDNWYRLSNSVIQFALSTTNNHVKTSTVPVQINLFGGTVFYRSGLVNSTDFENATWSDYTSSNLTVNLGSLSNGTYEVWVGLRGARDYPPVWQEIELIIDTNPPVLIITNPITGTVSQPFVQVQGLVSESLSSLTFDVSNALEVLTNQTGYASDWFWDTNSMSFTTNSFQLYDVALTNGGNSITIHATDLAGNTTITNFNVTLDYSGDATPPMIQLVWPQDGALIGATNFTLEAKVDDNTAVVVVSIVDSNNETNTVQGSVSRDGTVWAQNLPLAFGTNNVTVMATDVAGNPSVTNFNVIQSDVLVTIDPLPSDQLNQSWINISGTVSDTNYDVWVNGLQATVNADGTWFIDGYNVEVSSSGAAVLNARAYPNGSDPSTMSPSGSKKSVELQPPQVILSSLEMDGHPWGSYDQAYWQHWTRDVGGKEYSFSFGSFTVSSLAPDEYSDWDRDWIYENAAPFYAEDYYARPKIAVDAGKGHVGATRTYTVRMAFSDYYRSPLLPEKFAINDKALINTGVINSNAAYSRQLGAVWGETTVQVPAGVKPDITPVGPKFLTYYEFSAEVVKDKQYWQNRVMDEIDADSGVTIENYNSNNGFSLENRRNLRAVYGFYQKLYIENTNLYWAGLGKLAGAPVYAGLSDAEYGKAIAIQLGIAGIPIVEELTTFQQQLVHMNTLILDDLAWQSEAYCKDGIDALEEVNAIDSSTLDIGTWRSLDQGVKENNATTVQLANRKLANREQEQILQIDYNALTNMTLIADAMSHLAMNPVPTGTNFATVVPGGNLCIFPDRWNWITNSAGGIWPSWTAASPANRSTWVQVPLTIRAADYKTVPLLPILQ